MMQVGKAFRNLDGVRVQTFYFGRVWLTLIGLQPSLKVVCSDRIVRPALRAAWWVANG